MTRGLDMKDTIGWYLKNGVKIPINEENNYFFQFEGGGWVDFSEKELAFLFTLFPENAKKRSILRKVIGKESLWFHKNYLSTKPIPTISRKEAISETAIIPSYIDYSPWKQLKKPTADIFLYQIPGITSKELRKIITAQGFIHELAHSIIQPAIYEKGYKLKFADGKVVDGMDIIFSFAELAEKHSPFSHYSSVYRGKEGRFESDDENYNPLTAISEEMAETITGFILGFSYRGEKEMIDPFIGREDVREFVKEFLEAEKV